MDSISIIDYIGNCNEKGEATGHVLKTLKEALKILNNEINVNLIITEDYVKYFEKDKIKYSLILSSKINYKRGFLAKLYFKIQKLYYVRYILKNESKIWFINTDFWLFVSLALFNKKNNQKIYVTNYVDYYSENNMKMKIKKQIFEKALKKIDYVFTTNSKIQESKHIYIPDYYFDEEIYEKYKVSTKQKVVYMCGGINEAKDIEGLVDVFNINKQKIIIKGLFSSNEQFIKISEKINSNIKIFNERVDDNEYYENISKNLFIILPYKKENYNNRSSGVILEAMFLESIIIAPNFLLNHLGIKGIGYDNIEELKEFNISKISEERIREIKSNNKNILKKYDYKEIASKYRQVLNETI